MNEQETVNPGELENAKMSARQRIELAQAHKDGFGITFEGLYVNHQPTPEQRSVWFGASQKTYHGDSPSTITADMKSGKIEFIPFGDPRLEEILAKDLVDRKKRPAD